MANARDGGRPWGRGDWGLYAAVAAVSLAFALLSLQVWAADWSVPWSDIADAIPVAAHFKTVFEQGWYEQQPLLGAPFGQQYHDFPTAETTNFLMATILGHLLGDWAVALNVYFVLGFPLAALAAAWFLRVAGASRVMTLAAAVLYAILPFHWVQGIPHLFIASYYVVPLGLVIALRIVRGEPVWGWRDGASGFARCFGRGLQTAVIGVLVGSTDTYFAVFVLIMIATAGIVAGLRDRSWTRFSGAVVAGASIVLVMLANMLDDLLYAAANGRNDAGFVRTPEHAEYFAFKLAQLLLPWSGHQIQALADLRRDYDAHYPLLSENPALGLIPALGLLLLLGVLIHRAVRGTRAVVTSTGRAYRSELPAPLALSARQRTLSLLAVLTLVAFLFGVVGGLGSIVSLFTDVLRSWNRIIVVIALFALAAVALAIDAGLERWARRARPEAAVHAAVAGVVATALLVVGYVDQTPSPFTTANAQATTEARDAGYDDYFGRIQDSLAPGDWAVQLPYQPFPESHMPTGSDANDVLVPYLHTTGIGWTGGGIKGRPESDWTGELELLPAAEIPAVAAAAGASGILLDRVASVDAFLDAWPSAFTALLGTPLESADGRYQYWSLDAVSPAERDRVDPSTLNALLQGREWTP
ncbi:MAG: hypothetical protein J7480_01790 [Microbacteriaceae bacterium]|nr:hypothetical protein [Microbacteriaceae bacterium]